MNFFGVDIQLGNAAFTDDPAIEVARILGYVAERVMLGGSLSDLDDLPLRDINGNVVGRVVVR